jgi:hypothetical protein
VNTVRATPFHPGNTVVNRSLVPGKRMRRLAAVLVILLVGSLAHAEDVSPRAKQSSSTVRLRGAVTVWPTADGLLALGGPVLRYLPRGAKNWQEIHKVDGDRLYRTNADGTGRVLAAWSKEPVFHLFHLKTKQHLTFPKPASPSPNFVGFQVDSLQFSKNGRDAIVFMEGLSPTGVSGHVAYRIALDGKSDPVLLFSERGYKLHESPRGAVLAIAKKDTRQGCSYHHCDVAEIAAFEIIESGVIRKRLVSGDEHAITSAQPVLRGGGDDRVAVIVSIHPRRGLLRWRYGDAKADFRIQDPEKSLQDYKTLFTRANEIMEVANVFHDEGGSLKLIFQLPDGGRRVVELPQLPAGDIDIAYDSEVYGMGERKNGGIWLHWGDRVVLLDPGKPPRAVSIEPLLKRRNEWASADIYVAEPESLWIGIEVGSGRDFVNVSLADIEKGAKPWK